MKWSLEILLNIRSGLGAEVGSNNVAPMIHELS